MFEFEIFQLSIVVDGVRVYMELVATAWTLV